MMQRCTLPPQPLHRPCGSVLVGWQHQHRRMAACTGAEGLARNAERGSIAPRPCAPVCPQLAHAVGEELSRCSTSMRRLSKRAEDMEAERERLMGQLSHLQDSLSAARWAAVLGDSFEHIALHATQGSYLCHYLYIHFFHYQIYTRVLALHAKLVELPIK